MSHAGRFCASIGAMALAAVTGSAHGAVLAPGFVYQAHNHPDGSARPPLYGLRLDELYDATSNHDIFTFDFDFDDGNFESAVFVSIFEYPNIPGSFLININGSAWGGRDINGNYANDQYLGEYTFDFTYAFGVSEATPDDDYIVHPSLLPNTGSITTPLGDTIDLAEQANSDGYSFRLGDEDSDNGHRGFDGVSGWGWLNHGGEPHVIASDWLFTVDSTPTPAPGAMALLGASGLIAARRRR